MDMQRTTQTNTADNLLAGGGQVTRTVTIASGEGALLRGQLLGKIDRAAGAPVADAGNTGDGTVTGVSLGAVTRVGTYTLECIAAVADSGAFKVVDPDGYAVDAQATVGAAYTGGHLNFTVNDGAADFVVGDKFTIAVGSGSGKYRVHNAANTDGSQYPTAILAAAADATAADAPAPTYVAGQFNDSAVTGYSAGLWAALRTGGIFIKTQG
ncbi:MAG: head decoration protein [Nitrospinota bacterium]|nr:head decoration protein [Nitrospinota bacterium]